MGRGWGRRRGWSAAWLTLLAIMIAGAAAPSAFATVRVSRVELSSGTLRLEGTATANRSITVDGVGMTTSTSSGSFRIQRSSFTAPADCTVDVNDGSPTPASVRLPNCTAVAPPPPTTSSFRIDDRPLGDGNVGTDYANFVTAQGGNGSPYRWSIAAGALPDGLRLTDFAPSSGLISGRPTTVQTSTFTVRATDQAGNSATRQFTITINPPRPLVVNQGTVTLSPGTRGEPYATGVFADGGTTPYSWSLIGGSLPPGLALQASPGRIQGTPTTAGTFTFTLRVDDSAGQTATQTFSLTINEPAPPPSPPPAPALVSPESGASVTTPFTISWTTPEDPDGISAYNWMVSASSTFATTAAIGSAAGTATSASVRDNLPNGTYFWRVQAVDGRNAAGPWSAARTVTVTGTTNPPTLAGVGVNPQNVTGGSPVTGTVTITLPAPAGGSTVALANAEPAVITIPPSVTVPAGETRATFAISTQPVTSSHTVVITASLGGESRFAFLGVAPGTTSTTPPPSSADTVTISRAEYDTAKRVVRVEATGGSGATLGAHVTSSNVLLGTLSGGRGEFAAPANPQSITVRSSLGGSATRTVVAR